MVRALTWYRPLVRSLEMVCALYNRRYEWDAFLHGASIAADRIVCLRGSYIVELFYRRCRRRVVELMLIQESYRQLS